MPIVRESDFVRKRHHLSFKHAYKMKLLLLIVITLSILAYSKQNVDKVNVTSIDQLAGEWQWESTCGGIIENCAYSSGTNYAVIDFGSNGKYIELRNGTVYMEANYVVIKTTDTSGILKFNNKSYENSVSIVNGQLEITRGELTDTYLKIQ